VLRGGYTPAEQQRRGGCGCGQLSGSPAATRPARSPGTCGSLLKRAMANFASTDLNGLVRIVKRKLKKIQYRPHLIDGCLAGTGLTREPC